ncbi:MAG: pilus (MSHA type) biogenesis protein MshL [Agarilytica sp.]
MNKKYLLLVKSLVRFGLLLLGGFILVSCANSADAPTSAENAMQEVLASQKEQSEEKLSVPESVSNALLPNAYSPSISKKIASRFDVSVNQVPARTFFVSLVSDAGVNVVAHPEVAGSISLELKNVTIEEVLDVTREVYGYEYKVKSGIYTIYPRKLRTEIFPIDYLDVQRVGVTDTSVQIGEITSGSSDNQNRSSNSSSEDSGESANLLSYLGESGSEGAGGSGGAGISPGARVQTLTKTDFWAGLNQTILAIVGDGAGRMVMTNPQAGLVVVKALPNELHSVKDFLEKSELSVKRQVVLETKILEVRLNDGFQAGINWGAISGQLSMSQTNSGNSSLSDIVFDNGGGVESLISTVLDVPDITKLLFLLEEQGNVQVLSSPRISTVNNQKAVIRVGSDEFFVTGLSNSTTSSASSIVNTPEVELDSFFSGIALDVTPQISEEGEVILHVHPMVTTVTDQIKEIDIAGSAFSLPLALRDVRESDSIVKARSGQVVVLGGLMQETTSDVDTKRAFLGNIPVVNLLFKAKQKSTVKTELVILMQPIVVGENTWQRQLEDHATRIQGISEEFRSR